MRHVELVLAGVLLLVLVTACSRKVDLAVPGGGAGMLFAVEGAASGGTRAMLDAVRERLAFVGVRDATVTAEEDDRIRVLLPGVDARGADRVERLLVRPTRVAFAAVDDGRAFFERARQELAADGPVRVAFDSYRRGAGGEHAATAYLTSADRGALQAVLEQLEPPEGTRLRVLPGKFATFAYLVEDPPGLDRPEIEEARVVSREPAGDAVVSMTLAGRDREAFAALTRRQLHRRLAILVDGEIRSLPVVQEVIGSGRARIGPSPVTPKEGTEQEARALAAGIRAWKLAGGLVLVRRQLTPAGGR